MREFYNLDIPYYNSDIDLAIYLYISRKEA